MSEVQAMVHTAVMIDDTSWLLDGDQDVTDLKQRVEEAAATAGRFVGFIVVGGGRVDVHVTPLTRVVISVATVTSETSDMDTGVPFDALFDL
jgi:hypothetical protein